MRHWPAASRWWTFLPELLFAAATACSAPPRRAASPAASPHASAAQGDRRPGAGAAPAAAGAPVTRAECERLIDHVIAIARREQAARLPSQRRPTDAQVAAIRRSLEQELMKPCLRADRAQLSCGMAAATSRALARCYAPAAAAGRSGGTGAAPPPE